MQSNRSRDTKPELALRRELHRRGLRFRVNFRPLQGLRRSVDIAFPGQSIAVLVDGCFWHGCPEHYRPSARNEEYWSDKVAANRARDLDTDRWLAASGWTVVRVWEHEPVAKAADTVENVVRARRAQSGK